MKKSAIWVKSDKNGNELLTIKTPEGSIVNGVTNAFKKEDKHPDFRIIDFSKTDENQNPLEIGAAWYSKTKTGRLCLKIRDAAGNYFTAVDNNRKKSENAPDMVVL